MSYKTDQLPKSFALWMDPATTPDDAVADLNAHHRDLDHVHYLLLGLATAAAAAIYAKDPTLWVAPLLGGVVTFGKESGGDAEPWEQIVGAALNQDHEMVAALTVGLIRGNPDHVLEVVGQMILFIRHTFAHLTPEDRDMVMDVIRDGDPCCPDGEGCNL